MAGQPMRLEDLLPGSKVLWADLDPERIAISPTAACAAGCSELHYATIGDQELMVKHLYRPERFETHKRAFRGKLNEKITRTVHAHADELSQRPYVELRCVTDSGGYVTNRYPGASIGLMLNVGLVNLSKQRKAEVLAFLTDHVAGIHDRGMLKIDYNWGDVILVAGEIYLCDFDLISTPDEIDAFPELATIGCCQYKSREQLLGRPITAQGEVERLAMMAYTLFSEEPLWQECDVSEGLHIEAAQIGIPFFTDDHAERMPPHIGALVTKILDPDGHRYHARDIATAIRKDYSIE